MPGSDLTEQLPPELMLQILDWLSLRDLVRLGTVSRRWRAIVVDHPMYFGHPVLDSTSPAAVAFFLASFNVPTRKPWDVWVTVQEPFDLLETHIFPAVALHLDVIEALNIQVHVTHAHAVFDLLRSRAPSLDCLQLYFVPGSDDAGVVPLPDDILRRLSQSRIFNTLLLENVGLPEQSPAFLSHVQNLVFGATVPVSPTSLHDLARAFPALRDLTLNGNTLAGVSDISAWPRQWDSLDSLMLSIPRRRVHHVIAALPLWRIAHLTLVQTSNRAFVIMISHLQGPLDLSVRDIDGDRFVIHMTRRTIGLVRSFLEWRTKWSGPGRIPHNLLSYAPAMERVVSLTIPAALWCILVPHMTECSSVRSVTLLLPGSIWFSELFPPDTPALRPIFPGLRTLTLIGEYGITVVTPQDVSKIVLECLLLHSPLRLYTDNVIWTDLPRVSPAIESVHLAEPVNPRKLYPATPWHV